ncbi:LutB/LldF family L-lactate oxidation iron-sulfur protein [Varunaivibrio sulfuroxidans]|uniref:L-lactate dehydrogenase complex protein LldF n=1 Tax=Varunaivibrio sulfuroxidans TaxID=1773489 RepID=A0A4R3JG80_9PROT|nr:LutB/LldF family L-lactate oxidation iron-sulfur protein [Varunaivibrio sulfuroxidans]TCS64877.1 L-lactate dehydrogenase complex protein LldF [Varunaivibrio sulfuroxidans]WES29826.1 LutB/LldF family L-lactate oxidation iron-sulfur protein [Varunaivibrio sulfuroxidans]
MKSSAAKFKDNAREALADGALQDALGKLMESGFRVKRRAALDELPEFDALCDRARDIKNEALDNLDAYLLQFEEGVTRAGGQVHWAATGGEACAIVLGICRRQGARTVAKGKSMISEEIGLNDYLAAHAVEAVETDLGEYIIQLRDEPPSHIIAPAIHLSKAEVGETFRAQHTQLPEGRVLDDPRALLDEARDVLRETFLTADVGITGANMLIAETGTAVIVTNEGNGDLSQGLPKTHICIASLEKIVPTLEDAATVLRVLARSATGQDITVYTTFFTGARRPGDLDGPENFHVVLLDNGRSSLLGSDFRDVLRCIRCGACMNHCPVYGAIGGHAYGWVYPGPIGAVLTPALTGISDSADLPDASTLCGRCAAVCPVRIPLPDLLRRWREKSLPRKNGLSRGGLALGVWAWLACRPRLYHRVFSGVVRGLFWLGRGCAGAVLKDGMVARLIGVGGWTQGRDFPLPQGRTFQTLWRKKHVKGSGYD